MPTDQYAIVVVSSTTAPAPGVTDLVGNSLDGNFTGAFPSGANGQAQDFIQNLGFLQARSADRSRPSSMTPTAANDTGIVGDQNTNISQPTFIGQVYAPFPGTVAEPAGLRRVRRAAQRQHHARRSARADRGFTGTLRPAR